MSMKLLFYIIMKKETFVSPITYYLHCMGICHATIHPILPLAAPCFSPPIRTIYPKQNKLFTFRNLPSSIAPIAPSTKSEFTLTIANPETQFFTIYIAADCSTANLIETTTNLFIRVIYKLPIFQ